jgi:hypothetical protein
MKKLLWLGIVLLASTALAAAQGRIFDWVRASDEVAQLDPMDYHAGRVYRPAEGGGNIHVDIQANLPVTISLVPNDQWQATLAHPEIVPPHMEFLCMREHVVSTTYECHLPTDRPMVLLIRDERVATTAAVRPVVESIVGILGVRVPSGPRKFVSPNDLKITYYRWDCVQSCIQPEFGWSVLVKEKYELSPTPKVYSILSPDREGEPVWIKIKAPIPMTIAVMPSDAADKIYDDPSRISQALESTTCKQRGVQSLSFSCNVNVADGRQSLVILPEPGVKVPHKKAEIEMQANECTANCDMLKNQ